MLHESMDSRLAKKIDYRKMAESGFRSKTLPPYAYTSICPDPNYRIGGINEKDKRRDQEKDHK